MSGLNSLVELTTTLDSGREQALDRALVIIARELAASRAGLFVRGEEGRLLLRASCNFPPDAPRTLDDAASFDEATLLGPGHDAYDRHGFVLLWPIHRRTRPLAVLGLGPREGGRAYAAEELTFLRSALACAAVAIENGVIRDELRRVQRNRAVEVVQLHDLLDISRELSTALDETAIYDAATTASMGHFVVSRCGLYLLEPDGLRLAHGRGLQRGGQAEPGAVVAAGAALEALREPTAVVDLPDSGLRQLLTKARFALAAPLATARAGATPHHLSAPPARIEGVLAVGERASGTPFTDDDRVFFQALASLTRNALESARLHRIREEKQRQDRELQIAREIQGSLFPAHAPDVPGVDVAGVSRPCYEVGGDSYDWIPLTNGRLAVVVADVSGKGTPASLLMASVHAFVRALAGTAPPVQLIGRLNRFLFASTRAGRFVTLFYAELDPSSRRLSYVRAGHVPPWHLCRDGTLGRLEEGGPALGLLDEAEYETGEATLLPGDVVAVVTDGATEAASPDDREFGDERVGEALRGLSGAPASSVVSGLVAEVDAWKDDTRLSDDLTVLVLRLR